MSVLITQLREQIAIDKQKVTQFYHLLYQTSTENFLIEKLEKVVADTQDKIPAQHPILIEILHFSAGRGYCDIISLLVKEFKVNINVHNDRKQIAFDVACQESQPEAANFLLDLGADVAAGEASLDSFPHALFGLGNISPTDPQYILFFTKLAKQKEKVKPIIERYADGHTAVQRFAMFHKTDLIRQMEILGADVNALTGGHLYQNKDKTALQIAIESDQVLYRTRNVKNKEELTPEATVRVLLELGANPNVPAKSKWIANKIHPNLEEYIKEQIEKHQYDGRAGEYSEVLQIVTEWQLKNSGKVAADTKAAADVKIVADTNPAAGATAIVGAYPKAEAEKEVLDTNTAENIQLMTRLREQIAIDKEKVHSYHLLYQISEEQLLIKKLEQVVKNTRSKILAEHPILIEIFHFAAGRGYCDIINLLVKEFKVNINVHNDRKQIAFDVACQEGQPEAANLLLDLGANVAAGQAGLDSFPHALFGFRDLSSADPQYILFFTKLAKQKEKVKSIIDRKENCVDGNTALLRFAMFHLLDLIKQMKILGANVNALTGGREYQDRDKTALQIAIESEQVIIKNKNVKNTAPAATVQVLLELGANPNVSFKSHWHLGIVYGDLEEYIKEFIKNHKDDKRIKQRVVQYSDVFQVAVRWNLKKPDKVIADTKIVGSKSDQDVPAPAAGAGAGQVFIATPASSAGLTERVTGTLILFTQQNLPKSPLADAPTEPSHAVKLN